MSLYRISSEFLAGSEPRLEGCEWIYDKSQAEYWMYKCGYICNKWIKVVHELSQEFYSFVLN